MNSPLPDTQTPPSSSIGGQPLGGKALVKPLTKTRLYPEDVSFAGAASTFPRLDTRPEPSTLRATEDDAPTCADCGSRVGLYVTMNGWVCSADCEAGVAARYAAFFGFDGVSRGDPCPTCGHAGGALDSRHE